MKIQMKHLCVSVCMLTATLSGCGEGDETSRPSTPLTASLVVSAPATADNHTHNVSIPFTDPGSATQVNYQSSSSSGHTHTIALSSAQFSDLKAGMRVTATSATANGHSHTWSILGGSYLYDSICYNCHSNTKRGSRGMSSNPLNSAQRDALQSPATAPVSTATPADPNIIPPPPALDGATLYASNCERCHLALANSQKRGATAVRIRAAINANSGGMLSLSGLSDAQLLAIENALK